MKSLQHSRLAVVIGMTLAMLLSMSVADAASNQVIPIPHYFSFVRTSALTFDPNEFIVEVDDTQLVEQFKAMITNQLLQPRIAFVGTVVKGREPYNDAWNFHVIPASLKPGSGASPEVCDAAPEYIEDNVDSINGPEGFLPNAEWCPWSLHIVREVLR
jgi:hypothetical protein